MFPLELDVMVTVRNGKDPLLLAKQLSDGTFDFGLSSHDLRVIGLIGLFCSGCWLVRPCIVVCNVRGLLDFRKNHESFRNLDDLSDSNMTTIRTRDFKNSSQS
jgi:hypothetical protein